MALSDTRIKALKPKKTRYEVADSGGLFIEVQPSGTKVWRYRYRLTTSTTSFTSPKTMRTAAQPANEPSSALPPSSTA